MPHPVLVLGALAADCPALPQPKDDTPAELVVNHVQVAQAYHACAAQHHDLVQQVRGAKGIDVK